MARDFAEANVAQRGPRPLRRGRAGLVAVRADPRPAGPADVPRDEGQAPVLEPAQRVAGRDGHHHQGARSGQSRTVPLLALPTEAGLAVIGSNYGRAGRPAGLGKGDNLRAHPAGRGRGRGTSLGVPRGRGRGRAARADLERGAAPPTPASPRTRAAARHGGSRCSSWSRKPRAYRLTRDRRPRLPRLPHALGRGARDRRRARGRAGAAAARPRGARAGRRALRGARRPRRRRRLRPLHHVRDERRADRGDGPAAAHARDARRDARVARAVPDRRHPRATRASAAGGRPRIPTCARSSACRSSRAAA